MDKDKVIKITKIVAKVSLMIFAGVAASTTAVAVVKNIVPMGELTKINKVLITTGCIAIGGVAGNAGADYAARIFDDTVFITEEYYKFMQKLFSDPPKEENEIVPV